MKLIENGSLINHQWLDENNHQILSLDEYLSNSLLSDKIIIDNESNLDELDPYIGDLSLIVIEFDSFTDGRGFSLAYRIRQTLGYKNKLWVSGHLIPDQYPMAVQCGIDGILIEEQQLIRQPIEQWQESLIDSPVPYRYQSELKSNQSVKTTTIDYLNLEYSKLNTKALIKRILDSSELGKTAVVSSFGAESAVLLHIVAKYSPDTDVVFLNTGKLFPETLEYQKRLVSELKLSNVKVFRPSETALNSCDPQGSLCHEDTSKCCELRKVAPLQKALAGYDTWISGRKSYQSEERASLQVFEQSGNHIKVNPLANWSQEDVLDYMKLHDLPAHPLVEQGYPSLGCVPCTTVVNVGEDHRGGRWRGKNKTECGIHFKEVKADKVVEQTVAYHY